MEDADAWYRIQSVPEINHYLNWPDRTRDESGAHLRDRTHHTHLKQVDDFLALAVELDGILIGDVSLRLKSVAADTRAIEIAWIIHPDYAGQGYATEAATAALDLAFDELGARWATALIDLNNVKSIRVAERLRMRGVPLDDDTVAFFSSPALRPSPVLVRRAS